MAANDHLKRVLTRYTDFKVDLEPHPITDDVGLSVNAEAVKRSVRNLLLTGVYERRFRPYLGSGLQKYLFENISLVTAELIRDSISTTINNFEPRAKLLSVKVDVNNDENGYDATVIFGIVNLPEVVTLPLLLKRVR